MLKVFFWVLVLLNLTDYWFTTLIIKVGGWEANPLQSWFVSTFDTYGILVLKAPFLLVLGYSIYFLWDKLSDSFARYAEWGVYASAVVYLVLNLYSLGLYLHILNK